MSCCSLFFLTCPPYQFVSTFTYIADFSCQPGSSFFELFSINTLRLWQRLSSWPNFSQAALFPFFSFFFFFLTRLRDWTFMSSLSSPSFFKNLSRQFRETPSSSTSDGLRHLIQLLILPHPPDDVWTSAVSKNPIRSV